jgi:hypothetical protein
MAFQCHRGGGGFEKIIDFMEIGSLRISHPYQMQIMQFSAGTPGLKPYHSLSLWWWPITFHEA